MVDRCQYHACNGNDGSFLATATRDIFIFDFVVGLTGAFDSCVSSLYKHRFDVDTCTCSEPTSSYRRIDCCRGSDRPNCKASWKSRTASYPYRFRKGSLWQIRASYRGLCKGDGWQRRRESSYDRVFHRWSGSQHPSIPYADVSAACETSAPL